MIGTERPASVARRGATTCVVCGSDSLGPYVLCPGCVINCNAVVRGRKRDLGHLIEWAANRARWFATRSGRRTKVVWVSKRRRVSKASRGEQ
jgi:hypothetical protein